jgi:hypothetical protein
MKPLSITNKSVRMNWVEAKNTENVWKVFLSHWQSSIENYGWLQKD